MSEVFVSTGERRASPSWCNRKQDGAYPRGTGSNPVEGNGHSFPSYRQLYLSSFSDTHTHTHTHMYTHTHTLSACTYYEPCQEMLRSKSPALALKPKIISDHRINVSCSSYNITEDELALGLQNT